MCPVPVSLRSFWISPVRRTTDFPSPVSPNMMLHSKNRSSQRAGSGATYTQHAFGLTTKARSMASSAHTMRAFPLLAQTSTFSLVSNKALKVCVWTALNVSMPRWSWNMRMNSGTWTAETGRGLMSRSSVNGAAALGSTSWSNDTGSTVLAWSHRSATTRT